MKPATRESTSQYAVEMIDFNIEKGYIGAALMIASNYSQLRLGSLLADHYCLGSDNWQEVAELYRAAIPRVLVKRCRELGILDKREEKRINALFDLRNNAAHKIDLWKRPERIAKKHKALKTQVTSACNKAKTFITRTSPSQD
jgi:hypothetical protein